MLETIFERPFFLKRHQEAPLLEERERFLLHLHKQGTSRPALRTLARELIHVVRLLELKSLRDVALGEVHRAAKRWGELQRSHPRITTGENSASYFTYAAKKWLRFHGRLKVPIHAPAPFADQLEDFATHIATEQGLSPHSVRSHCWKSSKFLSWFAERHRPLCRVSLDDVDDFLSFKGANGWSRRSVSTAVQALRSFFRHAERRGWCTQGIAKGIHGPMIYRKEGLPDGPTWGEVRQLLKSIEGSRPATLRARAALMLFAVYGLRSGEVGRLVLDDFDWREETFVVNHSKRGGLQRYPLQRQVGDSILEYITKARPQCACRHLFTTLNPPYRPVNPSSMWTLTSLRMAKLGIRCRRRGPHTLRHACATHLLQEGASFKEIGDFLGHRNPESVGIYAKVDLSMLRKVAEVDLGGLL
jgi:integrase/recombinase XerD